MLSTIFSCNPSAFRTLLFCRKGVKASSLGPWAEDEKGTGTADGASPLFESREFLLYRLAIISLICLVAMPMGRSSGMPAQARIVVSRSP